MTARISTSTRVKVALRDNLECLYCLDDLSDKNFTIDHVLPKSFGGSNKMDNLVTSCKECNIKKGSLLLTEFINRYSIRITDKIASHL